MMASEGSLQRKISATSKEVEVKGNVLKPER